jgi:hypothetical protein
MRRKVEFKLGDIMSKEVIFLYRLKKGESVTKILQDMFPDYYCDFIRFPREVRDELIRKFRTTDMSLREFLDLIDKKFNELFLF